MSWFKRRTIEEKSHPQNLESIGSFYVTDRSFELISQLLDLSAEKIDSLPQNGRVLEVGSGIHRKFAEGISKLRPDLKIVSVDPTLGITKNDFSSIVERDDEGNIKSVHYTNQIIMGKNDDRYSQGILEDTHAVRKERLKKSSGEVVASLAPKLPFKDKSFDLIVDTFGPGIYLQNQGESGLKEYLIRVCDLLTTGGEALIFPVLKISSREVNEKLREESKIYFEELIKNLNLNVDLEFREIKLTPDSFEYLLIIKKR